jgi:hypothetical protein
MAQANVGDLVQVDISGIQTPSVAIGDGILAPGEIVDIDAAEGVLTVDLGVSFDGKHLVTVPFARAKLVPETQTDLVRAALAHAR